jgi:uncharacterized protein YwlG (UPF0340 family)
MKRDHTASIESAIISRLGRLSRSKYEGHRVGTSKNSTNEYLIPFSNVIGTQFCEGLSLTLTICSHRNRVAVITVTSSSNWNVDFYLMPMVLNISPTRSSALQPSFTCLARSSLGWIERWPHAVRGNGHTR